MWTDEQSLELIELYRQNSVLWDPRNPNYHKKNRKCDCWRDISVTLGREADECKTKMISLLSSYRRERAKVKKSQSSGRGADEIYKSSWFGYEALAFLGDRNTPRKHINTEILHNELETSVSAASVDSEFSPSIKKRRVEDNKKMGMLSEALSVLKSVASTSTSQPQIDDEINSFSNFIRSKMQKYDASTRIEVQRSIMDVIFKADERFVLRNYQPNPTLICPAASTPTTRYIPSESYPSGSSEYRTSQSLTNKNYNFSYNSDSQLSFPDSEDADGLV